MPILTVIVLQMLWFVLGSAETYYATSTCPEGDIDVSCMTLTQYATQPNNYFTSNTTLILLRGNHSLESELKIALGITHLTISASHPHTTVTCSRSSGLSFEGIDIVTISGITFTGCVNSTVTSVGHLTIENCNFNGQYREGSGWHLESISSVTIFNSSFTNNHGGTMVYHQSPSYRSTGICGGAIAIINSNVLLSFCVFTGNIVNNKLHNTFYDHKDIDGGAVYTLNSNVNIKNCKFINNTAFSNNTASVSNHGGGGAVYVDTDGTMKIIPLAVTIQNSTFINNRADDGGDGGAVLISGDSISVVITLENSTFIDNTADGIAAARIVARSSSVTIDNSKFINNTAGGGAVWVDGEYASVTIDNSTFNNNTANNKLYNGGGALRVSSYLTGNTRIHSTTFINNTALGVTGGGAVLVGNLYSSLSLTIDNDSRFIGNTAGFGGAVRVIGDNTSVRIEKSTFISNRADVDGGSIHMATGRSSRSSANLTDISLTHNSATSKGAAIYLENYDLYSSGYLNIDSNVASSGVVYIIRSTVSLSGFTNVSNNMGSMFAFNSNVTLAGNTTFMNNSYISPSTYSWESQLQEGGALTSFQSKIYFYDTSTVNMECNKAENGGAILATESEVYIFGNMRIADNRALQSGGGIHAFQTELNVESSVTVSGNRADKKGGGVYGISSIIKVLKCTLHFISNDAEKGGGICLELNTKLYISKNQCESYSDLQCNIFSSMTWPMMVFTDNSAYYGGAVYVTDDTNFGTCSTVPSHTVQSATSECFFQGLALYNTLSHEMNLINLNFTNNTAIVAGGTLFGGLLDRCTVSPYAEVFLKYFDGQTHNSLKLDGISYLLNLANLAKSDLMFSEISSNPVRVCFCKNNKPDCSYQPSTNHVKKGRSFNVSMVAVDHVNNTVPNTNIHSSLSSGDGRLSEGQAIQLTNDSCTELQYNAFSPHDNETLLIYAEGPCNNTGISLRHIEVVFLPCHCPIGFKPTNKLTECDCVCDPALSLYTTKCFIENQTVLREDDFWITFVNGSDESGCYDLNGNSDGFGEAGFIIKAHCPFDYCHSHSEKIYINFSNCNGSDAQCAFNRKGILCGACSENLSLSLGSSRCTSQCSNDWLALLIFFAIAGIALVAFLLVFNLTVANGTINGLIFYANIIVANHATFLPFDRPNFLTVFTAWLNLDFGFETCFYEGMDGYAKVWLQLAFPCYIIFLVAMVIVLSEYSHQFSRLISYTNPVATLATLILLSYTKLLRTIIASLSFTTLKYDGSYKKVWLYDANVPYLEDKHIGLFAVALFILLVGLVYTFLLMFWQLILWFSDKLHIRLMPQNKLPTLHRWYVGLQHFIDMYHAPYNSSHRYWTGLLLLLRGVLYLISAVNVYGDPSISLLSIMCVVVLLFMWKLIAQKIYKREYVSVLDTLFLVNLGIFTAGTLYLQAAGSGNQIALAYTSTSTAFITFLGILCYHSKGIPQCLYRFVKKKIQQHCDNNDLSIRAEESETTEEYRELVPPSPPYSVTEFDGLPDRDQDRQDDEVEDENQCEYSGIELTSLS